MARPSAGLQPSTGPQLSSGSPKCQSRVRGRRRVRGRLRGLDKPVMGLVRVIFSGEQAACPDGPTPLSFFQGSRQGCSSAPLACQHSTGGLRQAWRCPLACQRSTGGSRHAWRCPCACQRSTGEVVPSLVMPLWWVSAPQGGHAKHSDATLAGQCSTGELRQPQRCPSGMPALDIGVTPCPAMPLWHASARQGGRAKPGDAPLVCQRSTGGSRQAWRCPSRGPVLDRGVVPSW